MDGAYYTIDLDGKKEPFIRMSSYFKNLRTIILETHDDSLIGDINELQVFDGRIFVLDRRIAKRLFIFDVDGRFIRKIGSVGQGPGEFIGVQDFTLDPENHIIYLLDQGNRIHKYAIDGSFLNTLNLPFTADGYGIRYIQYYNGRLYASARAWQTSQDDYLLIVFDPGSGKEITRALSIKYNKGWNESYSISTSSFFMSRLNNPPRFNDSFMDYIVSIGEEITPHIQLKSKNLTTEKDVENFRGKDEKRPVNNENIIKSSKIFSVRFFVENEDFVLFSCGSVASPLDVAFNKKTGEVKTADYYINDLIFTNDSHRWPGLFRFSDSTGVYELRDTQGRFWEDFQRAIKNNEIIPDLDKMDELMKLTGESNPIIFVYDFK